MTQVAVGERGPIKFWCLLHERCYPPLRNGVGGGQRDPAAKVSRQARLTRETQLRLLLHLPHRPTADVIQSLQ
jgi:hypothetical protein